MPQSSFSIPTLTPAPVPPVNKNANYTAATTDVTILVDTTAGNVTITVVPTYGGKKYYIKKTDLTSNTLTIAGSGCTIDGVASKSLSTPLASFGLEFDGSSNYAITVGYPNPIDTSGATPTQDFGGSRAINLSDPINTQDAMTKDTATSTAASIPRYYWENAQQSNVWEYSNSAVVASGTVTFNLTTNGLSTGTAIFPTNVFKESINITIFDASNSYVYSTPTIGTGNKTITFTVNKVALSFGIIVFTSAANGVTVNLSLKGN